MFFAYKFDIGETRILTKVSVKKKKRSVLLRSAETNRNFNMFHKRNTRFGAKTTVNARSCFCFF